jgi:hypothetical protein
VEEASRVLSPRRRTAGSASIEVKPVALEHRAELRAQERMRAERVVLWDLGYNHDDPGDPQIDFERGLAVMRRARNVDEVDTPIGGGPFGG